VLVDIAIMEFWRRAEPREEWLVIFMVRSVMFKSAEYKSAEYKACSEDARPISA
jgi:hypothetical protein